MSMFENKRIPDYYSVNRTAKTMNTGYENSKDDSQGIILTYLTICSYSKYIYILCVYIYIYLIFSFCIHTCSYIVKLHNYR